jgi:hypothetical protein
MGGSKGKIKQGAAALRLSIRQQGDQSLSFLKACQRARRQKMTKNLRPHLARQKVTPRKIQKIS